MYRKCATEISVMHQKQVEEALLEMMLKIPYEDITVTQLCQAAGIPRRIFYHLFSNKTGALYALIDHKVLDIESYGRDMPNEVLRFFRYWKEQKAFLDALWENGILGMLQERMINSVLTEDFDVLYWLQHHGWSDNSKEVIIFGLSGLMGLVCSWYADGFRKEPEEMASLVEQMMQPYRK